MTSFLNDSNQELVIDQDVLFTKQVATFKNFKIKGDVTVSFSVPNNSNTRSILGYYGYNQIDSPIFTENYFTLVRNGNAVSKGKLVIEQDNGEELSLFFISGNGNWFNFFQFNCKEVRNTDLQVLNNFTAIETSWGVSSGSIVSAPRDYGIVFPLIDIIFKGQRNSFKAFGKSYNTLIGESATPEDATDIYPALYVHTLISEISKIAGVKISGTLLDDVFFKTLIITPDSPDLVNPETNVGINYSKMDGLSYVTIEMIAPNMKAIDFIKWACISFGCVPVYDIYSMTLELNIIDKFKKEDAEDWTDYLKSFTIYNDVNQNNYIRVKEPPEKDFDPYFETEKNENSLYNNIYTYNKNNELKYGELNIETDKEDGSETTVYTSPFAPVQDFIFTEGWDIAVPYIPLFVLEDDEEYTFASVVSNGDGMGGSNAVFVGTGYPFNGFEREFIVRVEDFSILNNYSGYQIVKTTSSTSIEVYTDYDGTIDGVFYTQKISNGSPGNRILSYVKRINANQFTNHTPFPRTTGNYGTVATAYHFKEYTPYSFLNGLKQGLSYGNIPDKIDITLQERYLKSISEGIKRPRLRANMLLPESVFQKFNFDKFVYLNTGKINGYFLVESIVNYKDGRTLVEVNLYGN